MHDEPTTTSYLIEFKTTDLVEEQLMQSINTQTFIQNPANSKWYLFQSSKHRQKIGKQLSCGFGATLSHCHTN